MAVNSPTLIIVTAIYVAIMLYLGWLGYKKTKTSEDYLVAGREAHPIIIALSYGATFISTSAIVGFGGQAANLWVWDVAWFTVV